MSEDHKKQLNILGEIRDQIKRLADLAEPTRIIFAKKPADDELVETVKEILNRSFGGGASVTNCVEHSPMKILERPEDCKLCRMDVKNRLSHAFGVNKFLNQLVDDLQFALAKFTKEKS